MDTTRLRRQPTLPLEPDDQDPPRKILKAKRRLASRPIPSASLVSSKSNTSLLIKPSLSKKGTFTKSSASLTKVPSLTRKASIFKETDDISTAVVSLKSGSSVGKTGIITEDDVGSDTEVTEVDGTVAFSNTGEAVVTSLRKSLSRTDSLSKKLSKKKSSVLPPLPPLPPGGLIEIAFSFDTTGSMSVAIEEVKGRIKDIVQKLQSDVPGIRIAIFAHGDYCDKENYIIKWIDFGASLPELHDFVNNCGPTGGGDGPECYELVLRRATEVLTWTPGSKRSLVIIGDNIPHEPGYKFRDFTNDIDWREECGKLKEMGVKIYGVACRAYHTEQDFYREIASRTDGLMITLDKFDLLFDLMMAICYREGGDDLLQAYQEELKEKYGVSKMHKTLSGMFNGLSAIPATTRTTPFGIGLPMGSGLPLGLRLPLGPAMPLGSGLPLGLFGAPISSKTSPIYRSGFGTSSPALIPLKPSAKIKKPATKKNIRAAGKNKKDHEKTKKGSRKGKNEKELPREKRNDKKYRQTKPLKSLQWSSWKLAMSNGKEKDTEWAKWLNGFVVSKIFTRDATSAGVFEFALQLPMKRKKYVIAFSVTSGLPTSGRWCQKLISRKDVREKFRQAISQNASVFVRRGKLKKRNKKFMEKIRKYLAESKYAFGTSKKNSRTFKVKGLSIS